MNYPAPLYNKMFIACVLTVLLAPLLIYLETAESLLAIWNRSDTFAHGYIILPISLWLIWRRREQLSSISMQPCWPALLLLMLLGAGWLLAQLAEVLVISQYAFVAMIPVVVLALLGRQLAWFLAFPLSYLLLMVPFGEVFIDPLINFTANFTVSALQLTGIPVIREGNHFSLPSGDWQVVEACSGLRYLIASFTLGTLYAYLTYRSRSKIIIFSLLSIVLPIVANGLRAYMIVMIGHLSGMKYAVGVDHLIYGWLFFGVVMLAFFWIGSYWREDHLPVQVPNNNGVSVKIASNQSFIAMSFAIVAILLVWPGYNYYIKQTGVNKTQATLNVPTLTWQESINSIGWQPHFTPANAELERFYQKDGQPVAMMLRYYRQQNNNSKLITSSNLLFAGDHSVWHKVEDGQISVDHNGRNVPFKETLLKGNGNLLVWQCYWIDGQLLSNDYVGKIQQAKNMLRLKGDDGAVIILAAPYGDQADEARKVLRQFVQDNLPAIENSFKANAQ